MQYANNAEKNCDETNQKLAGKRSEPGRILPEARFNPPPAHLLENWLFSGSPNGAKASSALYSLIETAKANGLKPYEYLRFLLEKLPYAQTTGDYKKLLPQNIDPALF